MTEALNVDTIRDLEHLGHVVGDQDNRDATFPQVLNQRQHLRGLTNTQSRGRLVKNDHLATEGCRAGDRDRLTLTAGERLDRL